MNRTIHVVIALAAAYIFFRYLLGYFAPFLIGFAIALLLEPLVRFLCRRWRFSRGWAALSALLAFTLVVAGVGYWGVAALYRQALGFLAAAPDYIAAAQEWLAAYPFIPADGLLNWAGEWLSGQSIRAVGHLPGALIIVMLILLSAFFFSRDREMIFALLEKYCPDWLLQYAKPVGTRLHSAAAGFLKTEFILLSIVAAICIAAFWWMGNPYAILIGLVVALLDSLPIVGSGLVLWPWAGYHLLTGQTSQAAWLLVLYGIIAVVRNVLGPRILGGQIGMHPLAAVMSIFMGIKAFGAAGILAGPALVIAAQAMSNYYHKEDNLAHD